MHDELVNRIESSARRASLSDGSPCKTISTAEVIRLADESGVSGRRVEITALTHEILPDRYLRNLKTLSHTDQIRLLESTVCIVGLGGLGGAVTETLARLGIGRFYLLDGDVFEAHNLNRQLLSNIDRMGMPKTDAAAKQIESINPGLDVIAADTFLTAENADSLVASCNLVVDCLDNIQTRFILQAAAKRAGVAMVSAAVAGQSGHVTSIFPEDKGLETIYGPEDQLTLNKGAETRLGNLAPTVNLLASLECAEVLKILLAKPNTLRNTLLVVDLADYTFEALRLA